LLQKYDLHLLEQCRSAEELSKELAREWLTRFALRKASEETIIKAVDFFGNWDLHKSHGRSIDAEGARKIGIPVTVLENRLADLVRSLYHQYALFFEKNSILQSIREFQGDCMGPSTCVPSNQHSYTHTRT